MFDLKLIKIPATPSTSLDDTKLNILRSRIVENIAMPSASSQSTLTARLYCNPIMWLFKMYIIANLFMRCSSSPNIFSCCKFMCAILCCCVYANFGLYGAHLTLHCVMTFMYNCWNMLLTLRDFWELEKIEFIQMKGSLNGNCCATNRRVKMQRFLLLAAKIKIIFPLCTNFNFFSFSI